jgi:uncharacterized protein
MKDNNMKKKMLIMIKPSSSKCQMACEYCFYTDLSANREIKDFGFMNGKTRKNIIEKTLEFASGGDITFTFQGGEPTLIGLDFYEEFKSIVDKLNYKNSNINYAIQTNGLLIDDNWMKWLKENNVLVGISLDGIEKIHNEFRRDKSGRGTFSKVYITIKELQRENIDFNILTVVTDQLISNIEDVFKFYCEENFKFLQFIPLIPSTNGKGSNGLSGKKYGDFLIKLYDLWKGEIEKNNPVSIRFFDNLYGLFKGYEYSACEMTGHCNMQNIIESDGSIYPCDFYAIQEYKIGNINEMDFCEIYKSERAKEFIKKSFKKHSDCLNCKYFPYCRGGCRRYFGENNKNLYCEGFNIFYNNRLEDIKAFARMY